MWEFGTVPTGIRYSATKSLPIDISGHLSQFDIVSSYQVGSFLPRDGEFVLNLDRRTGTVTGTFAAGVTYSVTFEFVDAHQCPVGTLTILIGAEGTPPTQTPEPETPQTETPQTTRACMSVAAVYEQAGFLFFRGSTTSISVPVLINYDETRETAFQLCGTPRQQVLLIAEETYWTEAKVEVPFDRWERLNASGAWETVSEEPYLSVTLVNDASYRAVYAGASQGTTTPTTPQQSEACLGVDAVFIYQRIGTTTAYQQTPTEEPLSVQITVNQNQYKTTKFALCAAPGTQYYLAAPQEHYTATEQRLLFAYWERYDAQEQSWVAFSEAQMLRVTLQSGGQIRAVYRSGTTMY